jgi:DNA-binding MarR family transcriptional regulator
MTQLEVDMFILGFGLGMVMQVLVIAVQNVVEYRDLGTATSGVTFFRSIGSSFGVAVFGAIFANELVKQLRLAFGSSAASFDQAASSPAALAHLPPAIHAAFAHAYAAALHPVFIFAGVIGFVAFLLVWALPEVPLRATSKATDLEETFAMPIQRTSAAEIRRALSVLASRENRSLAYTRLVREAGIDLTPPQAWLLIRIGQLGPHSPADLARILNAPAERFAAVVDELRNADLVTAGEELQLTDAGRGVYDRLVTARTAAIETYLADWPPEQRAQMHDVIVDLAQRFLSEDFDARLETAALRIAT